MNALARSLKTFLSLFVLTSMILIGCAPVSTEETAAPTSTPNIPPEEGILANSCPITEPVWEKPPEDSAVQNKPEYGYYFVNEDRSMWASAGWAGKLEDYQVRAGKEGVKVGWFRPQGAVMVIAGHRINEQEPLLESHIPCCYPTRFQATGLIFPKGGCWEVTATAANSELSFVVWVEP